MSSFFNFGGISFSNKSDARSSANKLTGNSQYDTNIFKFPIDIGNADKGHYMIIHINQQENTNFKNNILSDKPTVIENRVRFGTTNLPSIIGTAVRPVSDSLNLNIDLPKDFDLKFLRTINRTSDTIALYMPDTLNFIHNQSYSDLEMTGTLAAAASVGFSFKDMLEGDSSNATLKGVIKNLSPFIARAAAVESSFLRAVFAGAAQKVINPMMEMIYTSPAFREFRFDFMFYPRDEKESNQVQKIIQKLKFHQAPEFDYSDGGLGFFMIPPSEFDIKFYYSGKENPNIPKISTCVLTAIDVDYAPNGFASYEVPGENDPHLGKTGMPVGIRMSLQFKETEIMTKKHFEMMNEDDENKTSV
jgi:hypothetical protein